MTSICLAVSYRKMWANHRMHGSGGGQRIFEINVNSRHPVMRVDYEVLGLQVTVATISGFWFST